MFDSLTAVLTRGKRQAIRRRGIQIPRPEACSGRACPHWLATTSYVRKHHGNRSDVLLADVRSSAEFSERVSGYDYLDRKERIPGAVHFGDTDEGSHLYSRRRDVTLRLPAEILAMRKERGIVSTKYPSQFDREVIFHCGGGWRSSVSFYCAWLMGYENIFRWLEWLENRLRAGSIG